MASSRASFDQLLPKSTEESSDSPSNSQCKTKETLQSLTSFDDLVFLKKISQAKFAVYLVQSSSLGSHFALKVFPYNNDRINARYINETRFTHLVHPNIISVLESQEFQEIYLQEKRTKVSYILMEYASHGDFFDLVMSSDFEWEEKLVRTYFHQLVEGIEYLHANGIAHLDLKLENLLVSDDFTLKITDFDLAYISKDGRINTKGTKNYRSPELLARQCEDPQAADIYSAGVLLFVLKCGGILPHLEDQAYQGIDLWDLLHHRPDSFWDQHYSIQKKSGWFFDKSFKALFISMTRPDPVERATLLEIKSSKWYQGPVYSKKELTSRMKEAWSMRN